MVPQQQVVRQVGPQFACQLTGPLYVTFPDGEVLETVGPPAGWQPYSKQYPWPVEPFLEDKQTQSFIELNFLTRPPLSNDEIRMMPVSEVISLYYSLRHIKPPCSITPDPIVSAGLGKLGKDHELNLQSRIFAIRTDLQTVTYGGKTYRVLCQPHLLDPPPCPNSGLGMGIGGIVADVVAYFIPIVGWAYAIASTAYTVVDTVEQLKAAGAAADLVNEIQTGITLAKKLVHDPAPDPVAIGRLRDSANAWFARIKQVKPIANTVNIQGVHACGPITPILAQFQSVGDYAAHWRPYENYFFSKTVHDLVFPAGSPATASTAIPAPVAAGLGIGALLLLLL